MNNQEIINSNCKLVNTVWIEKGIVLTIIYYLIKKYDLIINKIIIIDNIRYISLFKLLFPKLVFEKYIKHNKKNFYFNIRKIIKKQDVIIDYINNYDGYINTDKIKLVPWFDMNDILISYIYNSKKKLYTNKYLNFIINFNKCRRANYNNNIYDKVMENQIYYYYLNNNNNINIEKLNQLINKYIYNYTDTVNNYIIPIEVKNKKNNLKIIQEKNDNNLKIIKEEKNDNNLKIIKEMKEMKEKNDDNLKIIQEKNDNNLKIIKEMKEKNDDNLKIIREMKEKIKNTERKIEDLNQTGVDIGKENLTNISNIKSQLDNINTYNSEQFNKFIKIIKKKFLLINEILNNQIHSK